MMAPMIAGVGVVTGFWHITWIAGSRWLVGAALPTPVALTKR